MSGHDSEDLVEQLRECFTNIRVVPDREVANDEGDPGQNRGLLPESWAISREVPEILRLDLYGEAKLKETKSLRVAQRFLMASPQPRTLVFSSIASGPGKSFGAAWILLWRRFHPDHSDREPTGMFVSADDFAGFGRTKQWRRRNQAKLCDVLVLDDLGDEFPDKDGVNQHVLSGLIKFRHRQAKTTIITTNLTRSDIAKRYGSRIADRLNQRGAWVECEGESLRR